MATQGVVSVMQEGKVVMKFITGSDGMHAPALAETIRYNGELPQTLDSAYQMALDHEFGHKEVLVVMSASEIKFEGDEDIPHIYRHTFEQPKFNPRWRLGTADYVEIVRL